MAPEMLLPLRRHWYDRGAVPAATAEKVAEAGAVTVRSAGGVVMLGATLTVSAAAALVTWLWLEISKGRQRQAAHQ